MSRLLLPTKAGLPANCPYQETERDRKVLENYKKVYVATVYGVDKTKTGEPRINKLVTAEFYTSIHAGKRDTAWCYCRLQIKTFGTIWGMSLYTGTKNLGLALQSALNRAGIILFENDMPGASIDESTASMAAALVAVASSKFPEMEAVTLFS